MVSSTLEKPKFQTKERREMRNLAGDRNCDAEIRNELVQAGIKIVQHRERLRSEVPASITGKLGIFEFERAWYYWMVSGNVPLAVAQEMYENPVGKQDVRVIGHCGCPPPHEWTTLVKDRPVITHYHIDSQEGLNLFVATLKKHGLVA